MEQKLDEGLLFDLLTKRRAGKFTADELLFAADHPEFIRWAMAHLEEASGLAEHKLVTVKRELSPSEILAPNLILDGWEIVEDVEPTLKSAADLGVVSFFEPGESYVPGETMRSRARAKRANLGLVDLKVALADQKKIVVDDDVHCIVFSGTVLQNPNGSPCVAFLDRSDDGWCLRWRGVAFDWGGNDRLARCK
jgi:hypothetical protein